MTKNNIKFRIGAEIILTIRRRRVIKDKKKNMQKYYCRRKGGNQVCLTK